MAIEYIYPTQKGLNLIAKAQAGARIEYTRAQIGEGLLPEGASINALTALVTPLKFLRLATPVVSTNQIKLPIQFSSEGIGREFWWTEIGIMANDPDEGEILAAYGNAGSRELADHFSGGLEEFVFNCILRVANAAAMEVVVDSSLAYVALSDVGRPGGVAGLDAAGKLIQMPSAADVGAAKAAHNHTATEITSGVLGVSRGGTGQTNLANVTAGNASKLGGKAAADYALAADLAATDAELGNKANISSLSAHTDDTQIHITSAEREVWNTVSGKADGAALQKHTGDTGLHLASGERDLWNTVSGKADGTALQSHSGNTNIHLAAGERGLWNTVGNKADNTAFLNHANDMSLHLSSADKQALAALDGKADREPVNWITATLMVGSSAAGKPVKYRKAYGVVYLEGWATNLSPGAPIMQLPAGYRPDQDYKFVVPKLTSDDQNGFSFVTISTSGYVMYEYEGSSSKLEKGLGLYLSFTISS